MSVSLPLTNGAGNIQGDLTVDECLHQFTAPELLSDPITCSDCCKKTASKKQHVFARLPQILCLHLKRFDAARNKKIEDFVSYPASNLNMGHFLPHWCEVSSVPSKIDDETNETTQNPPEVLYNLFATVNHFGSLQSGHYIANCKVELPSSHQFGGEHWYECNDGHISRAGCSDGSGESVVLNSQGAYMLFYMRM